MISLSPNASTNKAIENYDKAISLSTVGADYARFQRAVMLGLVDKYDRKVESLIAIIGDGKRLRRRRDVRVGAHLRAP